MSTHPKLGQHFLADLQAGERIVEACRLTSADLAVEVGPGKGALTSALLRRAGLVIGVELDDVLCRGLRSRFRNADNLQVLNQDVRTVAFPDLVESAGFQKAVLVGNLPFQITGVLVEQITRARDVWKRAVLMVQSEVGDRMVSPPNGRDYGILSIAVQTRSIATRLLDLPPAAFEPPPKVHSSVIQLDFGESPPVQIADERLFYRIVRAAFQQRRKMLRNTLAGLLSAPRRDVVKAMQEAGIEADTRPERVSPGQFERLSRRVSQFSSDGDDREKAG